MNNFETSFGDQAGSALSGVKWVWSRILKNSDVRDPLSFTGMLNSEGLHAARIVRLSMRSELVAACPVPNRQFSPMFEKHRKNQHSNIDFWSPGDQIRADWRLRSQWLSTFGLMLTTQGHNWSFVANSLQEVSTENDK